MIEKGALVFLVLTDGKEVIGSWGGLEYIDTIGEQSFIKIDRAAQVIIVVSQQTLQGVIPSKVIVNAEDQGNFVGTVFVNCDKVVMAKLLKDKSNVYDMYIQATTGIISPPKGNKSKLSFIRGGKK